MGVKKKKNTGPFKEWTLKILLDIASLIVGFTCE